MSIPKILHQIWIGSKNLPEKYVEMTSKMKEMHPEWEYHLWTHEDIFEKMYPDDIYLKSYVADPDTFRWAFITDRIKLLLLKDFGGVYADVDCMAVKSFDTVIDKLRDNQSFFAGLKSFGNQSSLVECAVYGSSPDNRIINLCLDEYDDVRWAHGCLTFSNVIIKNLEDDVLLLNSKYFYDFEKTETTVLLHEHEDIRLLSHSDENHNKEQY